MKATDIITTDIDRLGMLLAQIADLEAKATEIKDALKDAGSAGQGPKFAGNLFEATYSESNRSVVDWKAIAEKYKVSAEDIAAFTKTTAVFSIKVTAR